MIGLHRIKIIERALGSMRWVLWASVVVAAATALLGVRRNPDVSRVASPTHVEHGSLKSPVKATLAQLSPLWTRNLRQRLVDPPPAPKPAPPPPKPPPPAPKLPRLVATFVESGQAFAVFADGKSGQRVRRVGNRVGGFELVTVVPGSAGLERGGRSYNVKIPKSRKQSKHKRGSRGKRR